MDGTIHAIQGLEGSEPCRWCDRTQPGALAGTQVRGSSGANEGGANRSTSRACSDRMKSARSSVDLGLIGIRAGMSTAGRNRQPLDGLNDWRDKHHGHEGA